MVSVIIALVVGWALGRYQDKVVETVKGWLK